MEADEPVTPEKIRKDIFEAMDAATKENGYTFSSEMTDQMIAAEIVEQTGMYEDHPIAELAAQVHAWRQANPQ